VEIESARALGTEGLERIEEGDIRPSTPGLDARFEGASVRSFELLLDRDGGDDEGERMLAAEDPDAFEPTEHRLIAALRRSARDDLREIGCDVVGKQVHDHERGIQ